MYTARATRATRFARPARSARSLVVHHKDPQLCLLPKTLALLLIGDLGELLLDVVLELADEVPGRSGSAVLMDMVHGTAVRASLGKPPTSVSCVCRRLHRR